VPIPNQSSKQLFRLLKASWVNKRLECSPLAPKAVGATQRIASSLSRRMSASQNGIGVLPAMTVDN